VVVSILYEPLIIKMIKEGLNHLNFRGFSIFYDIKHRKLYKYLKMV